MFHFIIILLKLPPSLPSINWESTYSDSITIDGTLESSIEARGQDLDTSFYVSFVFSTSPDTSVIFMLSYATVYSMQDTSSPRICPRWRGHSSVPLLSRQTSYSLDILNITSPRLPLVCNEGFVVNSICNAGLIQRTIRCRRQ